MLIKQGFYFKQPLYCIFNLKDNNSGCIVLLLFFINKIKGQ
jgi:hypothetical protein